MTSIIRFLLLVVIVGFAIPVFADEPEVSLILLPSKCVSLKQGQTCYADIELQWQSTSNVDVCIKRHDQSVAIKCWENQRQGRYHAEIATAQNIDFVLYQKQSEHPLARKTLKVAWVYKKKRTPGAWRVF